MSNTPLKSGLYGKPDRTLVSIPKDARQCSPLFPQSADIAECPDSSLDHFAVAAPAGTQERRFVLAHALRALTPEGQLFAVAGKKKGGQRLKADLELLGCSNIRVASKKHQKIASCSPPSDLSQIHAVIEENGPQLNEELNLWTQPGIFSWNRPDPGSILLMEHLPEFSGRGADLGCGLGLLSCEVLKSDSVSEMTLIDIDRRAIEMAHRNVSDDRITFLWENARHGPKDITELDFIVMNPPFHDAGEEDHGLGKAFMERAAAMLKKGGVCWMVANRHLPYERTINEVFSSFTPKADSHGFKVIEAIK